MRGNPLLSQRHHPSTCRVSCKASRFSRISERSGFQTLAFSLCLAHEKNGPASDDPEVWNLVDETGFEPHEPGSWVPGSRVRRMGMAPSLCWVSNGFN